MKELTTYQCPECQFPILMSLPEANELRVHACPHCESPYILMAKKHSPDDWNTDEEDALKYGPGE